MSAKKNHKSILHLQEHLHLRELINVMEPKISAECFRWVKEGYILVRWLVSCIFKALTQNPSNCLYTKYHLKHFSFHVLIQDMAWLADSRIWICTLNMLCCTSISYYLCQQNRDNEMYSIHADSEGQNYIGRATSLQNIPDLHSLNQNHCFQQLGI